VVIWIDVYVDHIRFTFLNYVISWMVRHELLKLGKLVMILIDVFVEIQRSKSELFVPPLMENQQL